MLTLEDMQSYDAVARDALITEAMAEIFGG